MALKIAGYLNKQKCYCQLKYAMSDRKLSPDRNFSRQKLSNQRSQEPEIFDLIFSQEMLTVCKV